jgi:hypothetical protein
MPTTDLTYASTVSSTFTNISNISADDSSNAMANANGQIAIFELTNLPGDAYSINSVRLYLKDHYVENRGSTGVIKTSILNGSSAVYYNENASYSAKIDDIALTSRTTSDGSDAWTVSEVNSIRISLNTFSNTGGYGPGYFIDYLYLRVNYDTVPKVPLVTSGLLKISGGLIKFDF